MIKLKHFMEPVEEDDGKRLWIEPINLTKDLVEWCRIDHVLPHLGPPVKLWEWSSSITPVAPANLRLPA